MRRSLFAAAALAMVWTSPGMAAEPELVSGSGVVPSRATNPALPVISPGELTPTPEMYFYQESMRLYNDPKYAQRKRAEFRGEQRERRIAAMKWFGTSNARPTASLTPFAGGSFSPAWNGNSHDPNVWRGVGYAPYFVVRPPMPHDGVVRGLW